MKKKQISEKCEVFEAKNIFGLCLFDMFKFMQFYEIHFKGGDADDDEWLPLPDDDAFELEW